MTTQSPTPPRLSSFLFAVLILTSWSTSAGTIIDNDGFSVNAPHYSGTADLRNHDSLAGADLSQTDLSVANFNDAILTGANLDGADLSYGNFTNVNFSGANLTQANLRQTDCSGANLTGAMLTGATLSQTILRRANLTGTTFIGLYLGDSDISGATIPSPLITVAPQGLTRNAGVSAFMSLDVQAFDAVPLTFQWKHNGVAIPGATFNELAFTYLTRTNDGAYTVDVSGTGTVTVGPVAVKVFDPAFATQPYDYTAALGVEMKHVFSVVAAGTPKLRYQWFFQTNATPIALTGKTNANLAVPIKLQNAGTYYCVVTNPVGAVPGENVITSERATLSVIQLLKVSGPANVTKIQGNNAIFKVAAGPSQIAPFSYQWSKAGMGDLADDAHITGASSAQLTILNVQDGDFGTYQCTVYGATPSPVTASNTRGVLKVLADTNAPVAAILHPAPFTRITNGVAVLGQTNIAPWIDIDGKAADKGLITEVFLDHAVPAVGQQGSTLTHTTPGRVFWTNHVELLYGTNTFFADAFDSAGNHKLTPVRTFYLIEPFPLVADITGNAGTSKLVGVPSTFGTPANGALLDIAMGYTIKTVPQPGKTFVNWTDQTATVLGTSTNLHFTMGFGLTLHANYAP